jgi:hypothetical protein
MVQPVAKLAHPVVTVGSTETDYRSATPSQRLPIMGSQGLTRRDLRGLALPLPLLSFPKILPIGCRSRLGLHQAGGKPTAITT